MAKVTIGNSVSDNLKIWRYVPLDGLVSLLSSRSLNFTPLSYYAKSDPFEGYIPAVAFEFLSGVFRHEFRDLENAFKQVKAIANNSRNRGAENLTGEKMLCDLGVRLDSMKTFAKGIYKKIVKRIAVSCWHINPDESEAMWKLYSDRGRGIAIQSTVDLLKTALTEVDDKNTVKIGAIKYLNFYDPNLKPYQCIVDGGFAPLLKRTSYSHEKELRAYIVPILDYKSALSLEPVPIAVKIECEPLIERLYVSPFASDSFLSSVLAISTKYGLRADIVRKSQLLSGADDLVNILDV